MSGPTKSEQDVLMAAYYWADHPTDREAKRKLYSAVRADSVAEQKRRMRALYRIERKAGVVK